MLWYIAIIGVINLGLGYLWGSYVRPCPRCAKARAMGLSLLPPSINQGREETDLPRPAAVVEPVSMPLAPAAAEAVEETITPTVGAANPSIPLDPETGLATREHAEQLITHLFATDSGQLPLTVALVELAPLDVIGEPLDSAIDKRMLQGVSSIVRQSLANDHTLARFSEQQLLVLVPHEDVQQASRRAEELRQRVETTEFTADGRSYQTTVTCALAEVSEERSGPRLFDFLQEALGEAKRYGGNRTFTHDGSSPTPVVPAELSVAPQQLAI